MTWPDDPALVRRLLERAWDTATEGLTVTPGSTALVTVDDLVREVARFSPWGGADEDTALRVETSSRQALLDLLHVELLDVDAWQPTPAVTMWGLPVVVCPELEPGEVRLVRADGTVVAWGRVA